MKIKNRLFIVLFTLLLSCGMIIPVYAQEVPDLTKTGSVSFAMTYDGKAVGGGSLMICQVGSVSEDEGNYNFILTGAFAASNVSLEDISSAEPAEELARYAAENSISGTSIEIGADGKAAARELPLGLYLIVQEKSAEGFDPIEPFLVSIPTYEDGSYIYQVDAQPKMGTLTRSETPSAPGTPTKYTPGTPGKSTPGTGSPARPAGRTTLPQTGQLNWPVPVLSVLGMGVFFLGWRLRFGKKRNIYEA